jgi:hypothetical protein
MEEQRYKSIILNHGIEYKWLASSPWRFTPGDKTSNTRWIGSFFGPQSRSGLYGDNEKSRKSC